MGKPTGFMEYDREDARAIEPKERIKNFNEFHIPLSKERQQIQGARCMNCGARPESVVSLWTEECGTH